MSLDQGLQARWLYCSNPVENMLNPHFQHLQDGLELDAHRLHSNLGRIHSGWEGVGTRADGEEEDDERTKEQGEQRLQ